jgi:hypothetical protein
MKKGIKITFWIVTIASMIKLNLWLLKNFGDDLILLVAVLLFIACICALMRIIELLFNTKI